MEILFLIITMAVFIVATYFVTKAHIKSRPIPIDQLRSVGAGVFMDLYLFQDKTIDGFVGLKSDEAMEYGQDILWKNAEDFNLALAKAITSGAPKELEELHEIAARIVKCAHTMHVVSLTGPISEGTRNNVSVEN